MQCTFTFQFTLTCFRCGQTITSQDFAQGNCQLIFPGAILQHKTCPLSPDYCASSHSPSS
ncbi:MAG: hypothetical protein MRECE_2c006 [Mycoplasmataceae bacterium CE_OT135]|nr:MAG: hypothetical protein MRECE_2c006 [Mycoplasmataceae bacterium CE_OT135]